MAGIAFRVTATVRNVGENRYEAGETFRWRPRVLE